MLSDRQFIQEFEQLCLDPVYFNHIGHVRIAWLYLEQYQTHLAIEKIASGIKQYATALAAPEKFHMTMTKALVYIIANRRQQSPNRSWQEFIQKNQDLISNAKELVSEYYSKQVIDSELARTQFVPPDKRNF